MRPGVHFWASQATWKQQRHTEVQEGNVQADTKPEDHLDQL